MLFFGQLPDFVKKYENILTFGNIVGDYQHSLGKIKDCPSAKIIPYEFFLSLGDIFEAIFEILKEPIRCHKSYNIFEFDVTQMIQYELWRNFRGVQFHQFLHFWAVKNLVQRAHIKTFLLTCEHYPWERMCIQAIRKYSPTTQIIGYQHTVIPQAFLNMFICTNESQRMPLPDRILTTGNISRRIMDRYSDYPQGLIDSSCGLRFEYLFKDYPKHQKKKIRNVLIALEITFDSYPMVEYVLQELKDAHDYQVRIRAHPALPWKRFEKKFGCRLDEYTHIRSSDAVTLKDDIQWADVVLYSGTTVGLESLMMGKPVIHFHRGTILSFDPLFEYHDLKWNASSETSLVDIFHAIDEQDETLFNQQILTARQYIRDYFGEIAEPNLRKFTVKHET